MARTIIIGFPAFGISDSDAPLLAALAEASGGAPVRILVGSGVIDVAADLPDGTPDSFFDVFVESFFDIFTELRIPPPTGGIRGSTTATIRQPGRPDVPVYPPPVGGGGGGGGTSVCPRLHYKFDGNSRVVERGTILQLDKDVTPECDCLLIVAQVQFGPQGPDFVNIDICVDGVALHLPVAARTTTLKGLAQSCLATHMVAVAQVTPAQAHVVSLKIQNFGMGPLPVAHRSLSILEGNCAQYDIVPRQ